MLFRSFFPFRYYEVWYYGLVIDEEGQAQVEPERLLVLHAVPDDDGWYTLMDEGRKIRVLHPATVEQFECHEVGMLPPGSPHIMTEEGWWYEIPPAGAERI